MSIPRRAEEFDDQVNAAIESVRVASTTSWDYIDIREAGFWGDAWDSVSSFGKGVVEGVGGVGKVVGDVATGNFSNVGKDVNKTFNSVGKDLSKATDSANKATGEGLHDLGQAAKATGNFVKNNWKPIAIGVGMGALALTGVGLAVDAGLIGGAAAAGGTALAEGAAAAGGTALAEGAAATGAAEVAGAAGVEGAASGAVSTAAEATAESGYSGAVSATEDVAGSASKLQKAKDLLSKGNDLVNKVPGAKTVKKLAPGAATAQGVATLNAPDAPPAPPEAPPPPPQTLPQTSYAPVTTNATLPGQGAPGAGQAAQSAIMQVPTVPTVPIPQGPPMPTDPASTGQMQLAASKKNSTILDLVEQFGLYPEDIKSSLTSWQ